VKDEHDKLGFAGRFGAGLPRISDGQLLFVQHMVSKMRAPEEGGGRIAVFLNGSPLFTGAAGSGESEIRRYLLQHDLVDAIVAMPNDFFFNTGIATYIWVLDNTKEDRRRGKVQLINANGIYSKMRKSLGSKRNEFSDEQIARIVALYQAFDAADPKFSKVFDNDDFGYITVDVRRPQLDDDGRPVRNSRGKLVPDKALNDTENIPLTQSVDDYMAREVLPYAPDAWIEPRKQKKGQLLELRDGGTVGYEIPFTRHFYEYTPLRPSSEILAEIRELEASIAKRLEGVLR
jgi:type I restriction enzyme M protein